MKVKLEIEKADIERKFGVATVEEIAATLYNAFHGECECTAHPFHWDDAGDFHGYCPWDEGKPNRDDKVVQGFRLAALAAYESLKGVGVGHLK